MSVFSLLFSFSSLLQPSFMWLVMGTVRWMDGKRMAVREHHKGWLMSLFNWVCKGDAITSSQDQQQAASQSEQIVGCCITTMSIDFFCSCFVVWHYWNYWFGGWDLDLWWQCSLSVCLCPDTVVKWLAFWSRELKRAPLGLATKPPPPIVFPPLGHFSTDKPAAVLWWMSSRRRVTKISELSFPFFFSFILLQL